jgi:hypothetical protein
MFPDRERTIVCVGLVTSFSMTAMLLLLALTHPVPTLRILSLHPSITDLHIFLSRPCPSLSVAG